jgi:hypothetical protein
MRGSLHAAARPTELIRWDKKAENYLGLLKLACALLWFRRYYRLTAPDRR